MGRSKTNKVHDYFSYNTEKKTSKCKLCERVLKGSHSSNLLRHFYSRHNDEYKEILQRNSMSRPLPTENKNEASTQNESETRSLPNIKQNESERSSSPIDDQNVSESWSSPKDTPNAPHSKILDCCLSLITTNEGPFSFLDSTAFQELIKMIPGAEDISISSKSIQVLIHDKAYEIRNNIFNEIKNKLLSFKADVAFVKARRFLGLNVQYIHDDKIILRHLGVIELHQSNTGTYLKENVISVLSQYGIEVKQFYSITSDNGSNMLSMTRQINGVLEEEFFEFTPIDEEDYEQLVNELKFLAPTDPMLTASAVRSAAHTLQLAVNDACNEQQELFETVRKAVKILRASNLASELKNQELLNAVTDDPTRWDSTSRMLERFIALESFCEDSSDQRLNLPESVWMDIKNTLKVLKLCRRLLKRVQTEQLTFGDFFISWTKCRLTLEKISSPFALRVASFMKKRQESLFLNNSFLAALYLDPRVNFILTETQSTTARNHLIKTFQRLVELNRQTPNNLARNLPSKIDQMSAPQSENDDSNISFLFMEVKQDNDETDNIQSRIKNVDDYFKNIYLERQRQNNARTECEIFFPLLEFLNEPFVSTDENIIEFWRKRKITHSQLYTLAGIVLATPPTKLSVEQLFSSLENILTDPRIAFNEKIINDILVIKSYH